jgi:hypothetical protein
MCTYVYIHVLQSSFEECMIPVNTIITHFQKIYKYLNMHTYVIILKTLLIYLTRVSFNTIYATGRNTYSFYPYKYLTAANLSKHSNLFELVPYRSSTHKNTYKNFSAPLYKINTCHVCSIHACDKMII